MPADVRREMVTIEEEKCSTKRLQRSLLLCIAVLLVWLLAPGAAVVNAQDDALQEIGISPFSGQIPVPNGAVNVTNGNLHLEFPLASLPQRGKHPLDVKIIYDSNIWNQQSSSVWGYRNNSIGPAGTAAGWQFYTTVGGSGGPGTTTPHNICHVDGMEAYDILTNYSGSFPDGVVHPFPTLTVTVGYLNSCGDYTSMTTPEADGVAADGSGYHLTVINGNPKYLYANNGELGSGDPYGTDCSTDSNGNYFYCGVYVLSSGFLDDLGRKPFSFSSVGSTYTYTVPTAGKNGGATSYKVTYEMVNYHTNFGAGGYEASGSFQVIQSIQLPDGTSYSFTYDSGTTAGHYGDLTSMTLPTGSTINFTYTSFFDSESTLNIGAFTKHMTRMLSTMTTPDGEWTFTPSVLTQCTSTVSPCEQQLQVTNPIYNGRSDTQFYKSIIEYLASCDNYTLHCTATPSAFPIEADYYNGSVSASNLLGTITQSFDFSQGCSGPPWNLSPAGCANVTPLSKTVTLPTPSGTSINQTTQFCYDIVYGNLLKKWEWNFYTGAVYHDPNPPTSCSVYSGVPTPDRTTTYAYQGGSNYLSSSRNIANLPTSVTVTNNSGTTVAQTLFTYDGATLVTSGATGVKNHDDTNFGSGLAYRGNVTKVQQLISGTTNYLTKSMTYDITGQLRTATDWTNVNTTTYSYSDSFYTDAGDTTNPPSAYSPTTPTNAYLTQITHPTVNSVTLTDNFGYYWGTGQEAFSKDPNGQKAYSHFYDLLNRPTSTILPPTAAGTGWTYNVYNSTDTQVDTGTGITSSTLSISCTASAGDCRHDQTANDGMGRTTSNVLVSDPDNATNTTTSYDSNGRVYKMSNPYRSTSDTTYGFTTYAYDGMDRAIQVTQPDGSIVYTSYGAAVTANGNPGLSSQQCSGYGIGYPILYKDGAGKLRQTWTDGFGRVIEADEPNLAGSLSSGYSTCYKYDLNNNLILVAQGTESRTFTYDLMSRLMSAANPEKGTTCYYYTTTVGTCGVASTGPLCSGDPNSVCLIVAPQANQTSSSVTTTTTYTYDALNRLTSVSYNDPSPTTPTMKYGYDAVGLTGCTTTPPTLSITNGLGRRTSMCDGSGGTSWSYDAVGDAQIEKRTMNGITNTTQYGYNLDSTLASVLYPNGPSGRTITYKPGGAQRPLSALDTANNVNYGTTASYAAPGQLASLKYGGTISFTGIYDPRMNPCWNYATTGTALPWSTTSCTGTATTGNIVDLKFAYNAGTSDNGNVATITNNRDNTRSQTFSYDGLNRVSVAGTVNTSGSNCWDNQYTIDRYGNNSGSAAATGYNSGCNGERWSLLVNSNNQLQSSSAPYFGYDAPGNMTSIPSPASASYSYDAEGHIRQAVTGSTFTYVYDGDGRRVEKLNSGVVTKLYWNALDGGTLDETDGSGNLTSEYVFLGGARIARRDASSNVYYYFGDQIGSTRLITNSSGSICFDVDYYPFGTEINEFTSTCPPTYKFTGQERDSTYPTETGLDYFHARHYTSQYGRFISPDPMGAAVSNPVNPQSWNQYSYVFNNPTNAVDPEGFSPCGDSQVMNGVTELCDSDTGFGLDPFGSDNHGSRIDPRPDPAGQCGFLCWVSGIVGLLGSGDGGDGGRSWNAYINQLEFSTLFQGSSRNGEPPRHPTRKDTEECGSGCPHDSSEVRLMPYQQTVDCSNGTLTAKMSLAGKTGGAYWMSVTKINSQKAKPPGVQTTSSPGIHLQGTPYNNTISPFTYNQDFTTSSGGTIDWTVNGTYNGEPLTLKDYSDIKCQQ